MSTDGRGTAGRDAPLILVVEDYDLIRSFVRRLLEDEGYTVVEAADGAAALLVTQSVVPAVILLDVFMPVLDGPGFAAAYRAQPGPHAPIILTTAAADEARWLTELGAVAHVRKPFDLDELADIVADLVGVAAPVHTPRGSTTSHQSRADRLDRGGAPCSMTQKTVA